MTNATISNARNAVIEFTGVLASNATVYVASGIEKTYTIKNSTTGAFTLALNQVGGSSVIWSTTDKGHKLIYLDGTNPNDVNADLSTIRLPFQNEIRFGDADNSNYASLYAGATITSNISFSIPTSLPTINSAALVGTTAGVLSFTTYAPVSTGKSIAMTLIFG
jgi:hypothetical protein